MMRIRDDSAIVCPYCGERHRPTSEDITDRVLTIECNKCEKPFNMSCDFSVAYITEPLNTDKHCPHGHTPRSCSDCSY